MDHAADPATAAEHVHTAALPEAVLAHARRTVAGRATSPADCHALLDALGLLADKPLGKPTCARCHRTFHHPGIRRRNSFCSEQCYRLTPDSPSTSAGLLPGMALSRVWAAPGPPG
ncbi:hypothetical protein BX265_4849 [Streptomyces sp. TLI_235]|nr:hypothetical protein [Streptomyces sp. TLI_235]PBC80015.1 hypothetical protein BX265_4849 [Streptomyces sp. TLI_235]